MINPPILCQAAAEYAGILGWIAGLLRQGETFFDAIVAWVALMVERAEVYVGRGNLKYIVVAVLILVVIFFWRRRR